MVDYKTKWSVNESLLQSYRLIFILSQAFFLVVGALLIDKWTFPFVAVIGLIVIWHIWFRVVACRQLLVDYCKYACKLDNSKRKALLGLCTEEKYVKDKKKRKEANEFLGVPTNWRLTRVKLDLILPVLYTFIWIILIATWIV